MKFKIYIIVSAVLIIPSVAFGAWWDLFYKPAKLAPASAQAADSFLTDDQLKEEIGQMLLIGFRGTKAPENSEIYKTIKDVKIGGVVLFDYDVPSGSFPRNIVNPGQTKKLILNIQKYSATPLFVAVDAEGGNVNRLKQKYGFLQVASPQKMGADKTLATVEKESAKVAKELKNAGFNMNLAPVVDLNINPKNPIIGALGRSFSADPQKVINQSRVFVRNHSNNNIIAVEKHFPGQGSAAKDSHLGMVDITNTYKQSELLPYRQLNKEGLLKAVMTAHIINKKVDKDYPATLSKNFLQDILRGQVGFNGVVISDDMQMAAISKKYTFDQAIIMAINAGVDVISILNNTKDGYDSKIAYKARDVIFNAVRDGKIDEKRITESYSRILNLKKEFRIINPAAPEINSKNFELLGEVANFNFGQALDIAKYVQQITGVRPAFLLAISQEELTLERADLCYVTDLKTGQGKRLADGKILQKTMHPQRDMADFLSITKKLGRDPLKTLVTCPMSFGWGGAMGPLDFIPSTWMEYKDELEKITGRPADPWNVQDAFLSAGLYLGDSGAALKTRQGEWEAAMEYFSGSIKSPYTWYANGTLDIADKIQADIDILEHGY